MKNIAHHRFALLQLSFRPSSHRKHGNMLNPNWDNSISINQVPVEELKKIEAALARAGVPESEGIIIQMYLEKIRKQKTKQTAQAK